MSKPHFLFTAAALALFSLSAAHAGPSTPLAPLSKARCNSNEEPVRVLKFQQREGFVHIELGDVKTGARLEAFDVPEPATAYRKTFGQVGAVACRGLKQPPGEAG